MVTQVKANIRLVVASCIAGSDYNTNYPGKSFGKSREATALAVEVPGADVLLDKVRCILMLVRLCFIRLSLISHSQVLRDMQIPEGRWPGFRIALYQYIMPVVDILPDGTKARLHDPSFLQNPDLSILEDIDSPMVNQNQASLRPPLQTRYKVIGPVPRPSLPSPLQPPSRERKPIEKKKAPSMPSSSHEKRTLATTTDDGRKGVEPAKKKRKINVEDKTAYFKQLKRDRKYSHLCNSYLQLLDST